MNRIITIGREFGSGGRELGLRLSQKLGIAYYDQEIITEISKRTELSEQYIRKNVREKTCVFLPAPYRKELSLYAELPMGFKPFHLPGTVLHYPGNGSEI